MMKRMDSSSAAKPLAYPPKREDRQTCPITRSAQNHFERRVTYLQVVRYL